MDHDTLVALPENEPKPTPSTTTASSTERNYFSQQALRAGIIADELRRNEMMMNMDPVRMAIQRELEKERIREDIIASQIFRRQELEAEVRRELAMERDLALRRGDGFSLIGTTSLPLFWPEPRMGMVDRSNGFGIGFGNFGLPERLPFPVRTEVGLPERLSFPVRTEVGLPERLPFQRNPDAGRMVEITKEQAGKVMHLARPITSHLAGTKRKVTATEHANDSKLSVKKSPKEWNCALCEVSTTSEQGLFTHLQGKKHKTKEAKLIKEAAKTKNNSSSRNKKISDAAKKGKKLEVCDKDTMMTPDTKKQECAYWCEHCQVGCYSQKVLNQHYKGKKHILHMERLKLTGGTGSSTPTNNNDAIHEKDESGKGNKNIKENIIMELVAAEIETKGQEECTETMEPLVYEVKKNIMSDLVAAEMETEGQEEAKETMESFVDEVAEADALTD